MEYHPRIVSWNITGACDLRCPHCYLDAGRRWPLELTTAEGLQLIDQMAEAGTELLILTGGEPLLRKGLPVLARHAADKGINVVMGTTGTLLNHQKARALKENGVQGQYPGMMVRARCAPYIGRLAVERGTSLLWSAGCLAGTSYCRITPTGDVTPCPYLPTKAGNVRANHFAQLWETSPVLARLRQPQRQLSGKCGQCLLSQGDEPICVGCRARAFAIAGDELAADPWCLYHPGRGADKPKSRDNSAPRADVAPATQGQVAWAEAAQARLNRVPLFIRGRVKLAAEAYVRKEGLPEAPFKYSTT